MKIFKEKETKYIILWFIMMIPIIQYFMLLGLVLLGMPESIGYFLLDIVIKIALFCLFTTAFLAIYAVGTCFEPDSANWIGIALICIVSAIIAWNGSACFFE